MKLYIVYFKCKTMNEIGKIFQSREEAEKNRQEILCGMGGANDVQVFIIERDLE